MKILVVTGIFPPDIGGPASYVPRISQALIERGHSVEVVTLADPEAMSNPQQYDFRVRRIARQMPRARRVARTVALIRRMAANADVVFASGLLFETVLAARMARKPVILKVVGDTIWERARNAGRTETLDAFQHLPLPPRWRAVRAIYSLHVRMVDLVITPSEYLKRIVTGWGVRHERISVIYNAVRALAENGATAEPEFDLVSVGRLVPWKGFEELIDLSARFGWTLSIVGDGPMREQLEVQAQESGAKVRFAGQIPQAEVAGAIRQGRVFVLNSSYEGLPHIVLEAMAAQVPVVATATGGTPETIVDGESGMLVPLGRPDALAEALAVLLSDQPLRRRLVAGASTLLERKFSFERMVSQTEHLLARAAQSASGDRS